MIVHYKRKQETVSKGSISYMELPLSRLHEIQGLRVEYVIVSTQEWEEMTSEQLSFINNCQSATSFTDVIYVAEF